MSMTKVEVLNDALRDITMKSIAALTADRDTMRMSTEVRSSTILNGV